jgi:hypothetical protein
MELKNRCRSEQAKAMVVIASYGAVVVGTAAYIITNRPYGAMAEMAVARTAIVLSTVSEFMETSSDNGLRSTSTD